MHTRQLYRFPASPLSQIQDINKMAQRKRQLFRTVQPARHISLTPVTFPLMPVVSSRLKLMATLAA